MTSKSFSSKGLLLDSMRRNLWALVLSGVGFFLSLLLPVLMVMQRGLEERTVWLQNLTQQQVQQNWQMTMDRLATMLGGGNPFVKFTFIVLAAVCGVALFSYLHTRQKVDFYHSLPISRTRLFANNFLTGAICTLSTYIVMLAIALACVFAMGCGEAVDLGAIGGAALSNVIIFLLLYALAALTAIVCGNTVIALLLLAWVLFSPMLIYVLKAAVMNHFFSTYMPADDMGVALKLSPVFQYFGIDGTMYMSGSYLLGIGGQTRPATGLLIGYLIAAAVVIALAVFLFRIRKSERAGTALAFTPAKLPIKVYMCLVMGVAFGIVFNFIAGGFWFWPGLVIGAVLFHWIVEIIYAFDFHAIFHKPLQLLCILIVLLAVMLGMRFDVIGYDSWLPDRDKLTAVSLNDYSQADAGMLTDAANIDAVYRLMEIGVQQAAGEIDENAPYQGVGIVSQIGSRTVGRHYLLPITEQSLALLDQIYQSAEYKRACWPLFTIDLESDASSRPAIRISADWDTSSEMIEDNAQVTQIIETLRKEALSRAEPGRPVLEVTLYQMNADNSFYYAGEAYVSDQDTETLALIRQLTGIEPIPLARYTEQVQSVYIDYVDQESGEWKSVQVTDRADIEALLAHALVDAFSVDASDGFRFSYQENHTVDITAALQSNESIRLTYTEEDWPSAIVEKYRPDGMGEAVVGSGSATPAIEVVA